MLTRMKKVLKKQKGFTLVELLAVIAILAIIVAIAVPTIGNVISKSEEEAHSANVELIENAAKLAAVSEGINSKDYKLSDLVDNGFLESIPDKVGENEYNGDDTVKVSNSIAVYTKYKKDGSAEE
ncbi:prepilin-type N-terminal cleavage/methylation domain-containing protein [Virgibacillus halodenitrificans]|uniref:Prepilin-type N-terminal cleavage/methylation domain-containing protein n=1 Tax=Virgibacillus halodenitrificans TaxID=1482 RepID=A0AAC9IZW2_VIRHA|nr:prepilin-type N-terminal cleavage/methylation domain-containing protein [Virgibacillus halodenitrificans]APC48027.1 prepilin-type N-terminal cleavage/methylation domain-containing protein [Virgibacillus halodenitrificans]